MKEQLVDLIEKLMAHESRKIKEKLGEPKRFGKNRIFTYTKKNMSINAKKQMIYNLLSEGNKLYDPEIIKTLSLEYLNRQIGIAPLNKFFAILRRKIITGEYDFDFSKIKS